MASCASAGYIATPIEQVSVGVWSASRNGARNTSRTRVSTVMSLERRRLGIEARQDHHELVAAAGRDGVASRTALLNRCESPAGAGHGVVPERVVDPLEMVEGRGTGNRHACRRVALARIASTAG
jgi:hypothetical protein